MLSLTHALKHNCNFCVHSKREPNEHLAGVIFPPGLHLHDLMLIKEEASRQYVGVEFYFERVKIELWYRNRNVMIG